MNQLKHVIPVTSEYFEPVRKEVLKVYVVGILFGIPIGYLVNDVIKTFWWL